MAKKNDVLDNNRKNIDFAFEVMSRKHEYLNNAHNVLDSKIGIFLGFVGTIAAGGIVLFQGQRNLFGFNLFTVGLIGIYISLILLILASKTKAFFDPPDFPAFYSKKALAKENLELKNKVIADMKKAYELNNIVQEQKAKLYVFAIYSFAGSILFLFLGILKG